MRYEVFQKRALLIAPFFLVCVGPGCVIWGGTLTEVRERIPGIKALASREGAVTLESETLLDGTPVMKSHGKPARTVTLRVGDRVNLPILNGRADYKLRSVNGSIVEFYTDEWFWACTMPALIHGTRQITVPTYPIKQPNAGSDG